MDKIKLILIAILLIIGFNESKSQISVTERGTKSAPFFTVYFPDVDSAQVISSDWFDATAIQGQSLYVSDSVYSPNSGQSDTVSVIIEGRFKIGSFQFYEQLDTFIVRSNNAEQKIISLSGIAPEWRFRLVDLSVVKNTSNLKVWLILMANTTNYLREQKSYGNVNP